MEILNLTRKEKNNLNISFYGTIGSYNWFENDYLTADAVFNDLQTFGDVENINVYINSPGGSVTDGCAIFTALKRHNATKTVYIDGQCSSIASVIAMAGDKIIMSPTATMMIHNPITALMGEAEDLRKMAGVLDIMKETIINAYMTRTNLSREEISDLMNKTSYFTSKQALEIGLITEEAQFDIQNSEFSNLDLFKYHKEIKNKNKPKEEGQTMSKEKELDQMKAELTKQILAEERSRIQALDELNTTTNGVCAEIINQAKSDGKQKSEILEDVLKTFVNNSQIKPEAPEEENLDILNQRIDDTKNIGDLGSIAKEKKESEKTNEQIQNIAKFMNE